MGQRGRHSRFPHEPLDVAGLATEVRVHDLEGDDTAELRIARAIDRRLPAGGDRLDDLVPADALLHSPVTPASRG